MHAVGLSGRVSGAIGRGRERLGLSHRDSIEMRVGQWWDGARPVGKGVTRLRLGNTGRGNLTTS